MALPIRVRNAFRMGHKLVARVAGACPDGQAWVYVEPIMRSGKAFRAVLIEWTLKRIVREPYDDTILKYRVRYVELFFWDPDDVSFYDDEWEDRNRGDRNERAEFEDEDALEQWLSRYLSDLALLRMPGRLDDRFHWW